MSIDSNLEVAVGVPAEEDDEEAAGGGSLHREPHREVAGLAVRHAAPITGEY